MQERLNTLTRDFVKKYDTIEMSFKRYKQLAVKEMECLGAIAVAKECTDDCPAAWEEVEEIASAKSRAENRD